MTVSADKYASKSFANGGRPGGVLTLDRFLEPKQRELVRDLYSNLSATAENAGQLWVLEGGMKYESISIPRMICRCFSQGSFSWAKSPGYSGCRVT
ncbi:MAG: phage portal protein [Gammaproteobacteria bacterium]|nr:phage portal protein [Gammaproteobacteria bacterium]